MHTAPAVSSHSDLERILRDFDSNETSARDVMAGLSDAQLNWQPNAGNAWSILQCVEHLALANGSYTKAMCELVARKKATAPRRAGPVQPSRLGAIFLRKLEPPVKSKVRAPGVLLPSGTKSGDEILSAFTRSHDDIRTLINEVEDLDVNRLRFRNPLLPLLRVRVGTGLLIMAAHGRRHLWQARNVRAELPK